MYECKHSGLCYSRQNINYWVVLMHFTCSSNVCRRYHYWYHFVSNGFTHRFGCLKQVVFWYRLYQYTPWLHGAPQQNSFENNVAYSRGRCLGMSYIWWVLKSSLLFKEFWNRIYTFSTWFYVYFQTTLHTRRYINLINFERILNRTLNLWN